MFNDEPYGNAVLGHTARRAATRGISNCDGCNNPEGEIKPLTISGVAGHACHSCRHSPNCDCEESEVQERS